MQTIAIVNEKGGTGKTTTAVNLSAALGEMGESVLLVDLDGQAASSRWLGVEEDTRLADALLNGGGLEPIEDVIPGVSLAPGSGKLDSVAHDLRPTQGGQLRRVLAEMADQYNYAIIDCPPSLGNRLIGNALLASSHAIAPVEPSVLALDGLGILLTTLQDIRDGFDHNIILIGALPCRYDGRTRLSRLVLAELKRALPGKVFNTVIRETVRMQECPASGKSILDYAPDSSATEDYRALARELLAQPALARDYEVSAEDLAHESELTESEHVALVEFRQNAAAPFRNPPARTKPAENQPSPEEPEEEPVTTQAPPVMAQPEEGLPEAASLLAETSEPEFEGPCEELVEAPHPVEEVISQREDSQDEQDVPDMPVEQIQEPVTARRAEREQQQADEPEPWQEDADTAEPATASISKTRKRLIAVAAAFPVLLLAGVVFVAWRVTAGGKAGPQTAAAEPTVVCVEADVEPPVPVEMQAELSDDQSPAVEAHTAPRPAGNKLVAAEPVPTPASPETEATESEQPAPAEAEPTSQTPQEPQPDANHDQKITEVDQVEYVLCPPGFSLTCVMRTPGGYLAMINGKSARIGQTINGAKVIGISLKTVEMELDGKHFVLGIGEQASAGESAETEQ